MNKLTVTLVETRRFSTQIVKCQLLKLYIIWMIMKKIYVTPRFTNPVICGRAENDKTEILLLDRRITAVRATVFSGK